MMTGPDVIDARGMLCPLPVLRLRKVLTALPIGGRVRLFATDPAAIIDVPHFCNESGHRLIGMQRLENGMNEFTVQCGAAPGVHPVNRVD